MPFNLKNYINPMLNNKFTNNQIILASQSPRRKELLLGLDLDFITLPLNANEDYSESLKAEEITEYLCYKKAEAYNNWRPNDILITADTIVWLEDQALEKPIDHADAFQMLRFLSGKTHTVISSVGIFSQEKKVVFSDITLVTLSDLSDDEITYYISKYQPFDKAGSYGIQEWLGYIAIQKLVGSYYTVMGLPLHKLYTELKKF